MPFEHISSYDIHSSFSVWVFEMHRVIRVISVAYMLKICLYYATTQEPLYNMASI